LRCGRGCPKCQNAVEIEIDAESIQRFIDEVIATKPRVDAKRQPVRRWTFEELAAALPESNLPTELWDGELIMSPAPSFFHQEIVARFYKMLDAWVDRNQLGKVGIAPLDMVLSPRRAVQPDVLFVANEHLDIIRERVMGAADLVAEVISPDSRRRDRIDKRDRYEQHGVREYWLIDPEAQTVEVLYLVSGRYQLVGRWRPQEEAHSRLLEGFSVSIAALFG